MTVTLPYLLPVTLQFVTLKPLAINTMKVMCVFILNKYTLEATDVLSRILHEIYFIKTVEFAVIFFLFF